jgi:amidase
LHYWTLAQVSLAIRRKEVSPVEVTNHLLDRIARLEPVYKTFVTVTEKRAREQARRAEEEIVRGDWRGPLHGVPITVKDLFYTDFARTTAGMLVHRDFVPPHSATVVTRLEQAGAVILGKVKTVEGAWTDHHETEPSPPNAWNEAYWPGASSTGSAVATAMGLCFVTIATDTGGSIRFPCQSAGITGLKPTWGRVSQHGVFPLARSLDHVGPMARSVEDVAIVLGAIAGFDEKDAMSLTAPVPDYAAEARGGVRGLRVGVDPAYVYNGSRADVVAAIREAEGVLTAAGAVFRQVQVPSYREAARSWACFLRIEAAEAHRETYPSRGADYGPALANLIRQGLATTPMDIATNIHRRLQFSGGLAAVFDHVDVIIIPVTKAGVPMKAETDTLKDEVDVEFVKYTAPYDLSGHPTITLPAGFDQKGLPIAIQIVGRPLSEALLCRFGTVFQRMTDWHTRHPTERQA